MQAGGGILGRDSLVRHCLVTPNTAKRELCKVGQVVVHSSGNIDMDAAAVCRKVYKYDPVYPPPTNVVFGYLDDIVMWQSKTCRVHTRAGTVFGKHGAMWTRNWVTQPL